MKMMAQEKIRKGPWAEQEDLLLVNFINLFGERRWDFIAKVSGLGAWRGNTLASLNRTGKSCRLRWVNYLHPSLKRGRMTPQEERLVLELHSKWGNRWSRIARKLPGRTDNEIKNYWRTHMRKKAQERKRALTSSLASSCCSSLNNTCNLTTDSSVKTNTDGGNLLQDKGCCSTLTIKGEANKEEGAKGCCSMDQIWEEIASSEEVTSMQSCYEEGCNFSCPPLVPSPVWDYGSDSLWRMDEEEIKMLLPMSDLIVSNYGHSRL